MAVFTLCLAGISVGVQCLFDTTREFCRDYLTDAPPEVTVTVTEADIAEERILSAREDVREGKRIHRYTDAYLETLALYRRITEALLPRNVLLIHGAVVAVQGNACLFTARSGVGKTTHVRLWLKNIPGCHVLNGDKPLFLFRPEGVFACGTPWQGKENYGTNEILPLKAVCLLERGETNHIEPITLSEALPALLHQTHHVRGELVQSVSLLGKLKDAGFYRLHCNMQDEAAAVAYAGMVGHGSE